MPPRKKLKQKTGRPPPAFWDNLSKIWLTSDALEELDRRNRALSRSGQGMPEPHTQPSQADFNPAEDCSLRTLHQIRELSKQGGPDLSDLRNFPDPAEARKRRAPSNSSSSSSATKTTTTIYDGNFEQVLIGSGVYPAGYEYPDGQVPARPDNLDEINKRLAQRRPSLSPSRCPDSEFEEFKRTDAAASSGRPIIVLIIRSLEGGRHDSSTVGGGCPFEDLAPLADRILVTAKPDHYYAARMEQLDRQIRDELSEYIIPSEEDSLLMAPNFFLEAKWPDRSLGAATRQVCYYGALGARAMHKLQCYKQNEQPLYDNRAYTITATYHGGQLKLYATHPAPPRTRGWQSDGCPEYITTQLNAWSMSGNADSFRQGATAYRNARDWAKEQRNRLLETANERHKQAMPPKSPPRERGEARLS
ncbi:hypothetical protein McanMca71_006801 [Microsporum canis]